MITSIIMNIEFASVSRKLVLSRTMNSSTEPPFPVHPHVQDMPRPQSPPAYSAQPPQLSPGYMPSPTYIVQPPQVMTPPIYFGPDQQNCICRYCHANIITDVNTAPNNKTHAMALILCCFLCWPFAWVPYVMDSCQTRNHYCPVCRAFLGKYDS